MACGANARKAGAHDQDVEMLRRGGLWGISDSAQHLEDATGVETRTGAKRRPPIASGCRINYAMLYGES